MFKNDVMYEAVARTQYPEIELVVDVLQDLCFKLEHSSGSSLNSSYTYRYRRNTSYRMYRGLRLQFYARFFCMTDFRIIF
jgi:hypothetical protein